MKKLQNITKTRVDMFMDSEVDVATRTLWLGSAVTEAGEELGTDASMAERAIKGLHLLDSSAHDPITVLMNNIGGDEIHGLAIADAISLCESSVTIKVFGHAMSMGSIILQAADLRLLAPSASVMLHYGTPMYANSDLHAKEQQTWSEECVRFRDRMERLYLKRIRESDNTITLRDVQDMLAYATIFTAQEAVEWGLADAVLKPNNAWKWE